MEEIPIAPESYIGKERRLGVQLEAELPIKVSVVIPVRNEEKSLPSLVASLQKQTLPPSEVLIVDGGSTDGTLSLAAHLIACDQRFRVIEAGSATPGRGRNVGTAAARYEWIAYTDAGNCAERTWLERLAQEVKRDESVEIVYGNYEPVADTFFERCAALAYVTPKRDGPEGRVRGPFIASSLLRRYVWQRVGGFPDLRAAEDLIFMEKVKSQRFKIAWAPTATVWWQLQPTLARTFRKFVLYSRHNVWAGRQQYWHYGIARHYAIALVFVALALAHSLWWLMVPLFGSVARVAKSIWRGREGKGLLWALNPLQFVCVAVIILAIDLATLVGWTEAAWHRPPREDERHTTHGELDS
jgi:glycosyltransferase involved in cell wall biosynthesis